MTLYGSIFYNCWVALAAFSVHFFIAIQDVYASPRILFGCFATAIIAFFVTFIVRYVIAYALYTPEPAIVEDEQTLKEATQVEAAPATSTIEFQDESSEDIAQVVRTMLHKDEPAK